MPLSVEKVVIPEKIDSPASILVFYTRSYMLYQEQKKTYNAKEIRLLPSVPKESLI